MTRAILVACPNHNQHLEHALRAEVQSQRSDCTQPTHFLSDLLRIDLENSDCSERIATSRWQHLREAVAQGAALLADLTPVDGLPEPDPDIAIMVGLWTAMRLPVQLCTESQTPYYDRVVAWNGAPPSRRADDPAICEDKQGMRIEDMGGLYNLMLDGPTSLGMPKIMIPNTQSTDTDDNHDSDNQREKRSNGTGNNVKTSLNSSALFAAYRQLQLGLNSDVSEGTQVISYQYHPTTVMQEKTDASREHELQRPLLYLAGPYVFDQRADQIYDKLKTMLHTHGYEGIAPTDLQLPFVELQQQADPVTGDNPVMRETIYRADQACMDRSQGSLFSLDMFRGERDSGTLFELGYELGMKLLEQDKQTLRPLLAYAECTPSTRVMRAAVAAGLMTFDVIGESKDIDEHVSKIDRLLQRESKVPAGGMR